MSGTNYEWVGKELDARGYSEDGEWTAKIRKAILELLHTLDAQSLPYSDRETVASVVRDLVVNGPAVSKEKVSTWENFRVGEHRPGVTVRVRQGAYTGVGAKHNGLTGVVTAIRGGRVLVQYIGRSDGIGHAHHPDRLEVLVKG
jgi:hypothetical protein